MKPTKSTGYDYISMNFIIKSRKTLGPLLLNLINKSISQNTYPEHLKISKIHPIPKDSKDPIFTQSWRQINILSAM